MVADQGTDNGLRQRVAEIYDRLDWQIRKYGRLAGECRACGRCCDFAGFDHRLFVTTPEVMYLAANVGNENIKAMTTKVCPYKAGARCGIYEYRFAGCRIFCCRGDADFQSRLSESVIKQFKEICTEFHVTYRYADVAGALNVTGGTFGRAAESLGHR